MISGAMHKASNSMMIAIMLHMDRKRPSSLRYIANTPKAAEPSTLAVKTQNP